MPLNKFLIAPLKSGLQLNRDPWLIMKDAWIRLVNVHVWREKIRKRFGSYSMNPSKADEEKQLFSRFRINIGTTDGGGNLAANAPGAIFKVGQIFSCAAEVYTTNVVGAPAALLTTGVGAATYNTGTGAFVLAGGPATTAVYFYPAEPVMNLPTYEVASINDEDLYGFDTQFAYTFLKTTGWQLAGAIPPAAGSGLWTGSDSNFYSTANYRGAVGDEFILFVVNGVVADQIQYWDGTIWTKFSPVYDSVTGFLIRTAKIVIPFKDRLLLFNTTEQTVAGDKTFVNRLRFSQNGAPTIVATAWDEIVSGRGGFVDAPTRESITAASFLRDRLIISFEQSTYEIVYTGNEALPFRFQKLNTSLGVESTNSIIELDKVIVGMGSTGIHACNGMNVQRIDDIVPDLIFDISNDNEGPTRVAGIQDYYTEELYWSYNTASRSVVSSDTFPNLVLVFNYESNAWAIYHDSITAFGYYQNEGDIIWDDLTIDWQDSIDRWEDPSLQSLFRNVVAGNQEGFTFIVDNEVTTNALSLSITDIGVVLNVVTLTIIDHNLGVGDFIYINNVEGTLPLTNINDSIFRVNTVVNSDQIAVIEDGLAGGAYDGGGTVALVSQIDLLSKRYNFFKDSGRKIRVPRIDFLIDRIPNGEVQMDFFSGFSTVSLVTDGDISGASIGSNILEFSSFNDFEITQEKIWRSIFPLLEGDTIQYSMIVPEDKMIINDIAFSDFQLHAVLFYAQPTEDFGF